MANRLYPGIVCGRKACDEACISHCDTTGSPGIYYDRDLLDDRLPDVPGDELYRDTAFHESWKRDYRAVAAENRAEFSDGAVLADFLCRSGGTESVRAAE